MRGLTLNAAPLWVPAGDALTLQGMPHVATATQVPYEVQVALIDATGRVFWYWDDYRHFLRKAGVHAAVVHRLTNAGLSKYTVMRELLAELDRAGRSGYQVQLQLVRALVALPLPDEGGESTEAKAAQARLRTVSDEHDLLPENRATRRRVEDRVAAEQRRRHSEQRKSERARELATRQALFREFCQMLGDISDKQGRGYRLEEMIGELAALDGLRYVRPFRKSTVAQTDGMLSYEGFQYLIEARWRSRPADVAQIAALAHKADRALESTRGLFVSVAGFRSEVVDELERGPKKLLLMTGAELSLILEGRYTLEQAMRLKIEEGAKRGRIFYDIARPPTS